MSEMKRRATAVAGSNIAFVKYWGNLDDALNIPMNGSISMTLDAANTTTTVSFQGDLAADTLLLNGRDAGDAATARAARQLDLLRALAGTEIKAAVTSENSFPTGAGIASSASGFAALTVAAAAALGLDLSPTELSRLARRGSGSACRSIHGGFVEWQPGGRDEDSYAAPLAPPNHWDLVDLIAVVSDEEKAVGSTAGHPLVRTSPFYQARLGTLQATLQQVRRAILERNFTAFGELIEQEALYLHVIAMTSQPSVLYWQPGTVALLHALRAWRQDGSGAVGYFTMDAGPNVHIIAERPSVPHLLPRLQALDAVQNVIVCGVGQGARVISTA